jgi:hypothetical protein
MSRLRRLVLSDRYFFVTCNLLRTRAVLSEDDFEVLARVMQARCQPPLGFDRVRIPADERARI